MKKSEMKDRFFLMFNESKNDALVWFERLKNHDFPDGCDIKHCYSMNDVYINMMKNYCTLAFNLGIISDREFDECYIEIKSVNAYIMHID